MKVLVTGATGNVGRHVVNQLRKRGVDVRAIVRNPDAARLPIDTEVFAGDLSDPDSIRVALNGVDKLFLLNAVVADELTQALTTSRIAARSGIKHITYLSVYQADRFRDVPHFASKVALENALRDLGVPHTILRPGYFFQNDLSLRSLLQQMGIYAMPIGNAGISSVDVRDIAEAAAVTLVESGHAGQTYDLVSSSQLTGPANAHLWSKALNTSIVYAGHDFDAWEKQMSKQIPGWLAYDLRAMMEGYVERGFNSTEVELSRSTKLLGHAPRTYEAFVQETVAAWAGNE